MIAIIDYGAGNLFSVKNALDFLGLPCIITKERHEIEKSDQLILPGVGAFPSAMRMLEQTGLVDFLKEQAARKPFLGICLGAQLLFDKGYEFEQTSGLGLIRGEVVKINAPGLKIPHVGWNSLRFVHSCPLLAGLDEGCFVYFVHSFRFQTDPRHIAADCQYGETIPALAFEGNIFGAQFHPEKSGEVGLQMLRNFGGLK